MSCATRSRARAIPRIEKHAIDTHAIEKHAIDTQVIETHA